MSEHCAVPGCMREALEQVDTSSARMCRTHAVAWDRDEDGRGRRLTELHLAKPGATMDDVWAEHFSEWCGARKVEP